MNKEIIICQYCGKICKNKMSKVRHEYFCKLNPEYEKHLQKHKDTTVKASKNKEVLNKLSKNARDRRQKFLIENPDETYQDFELTCKKCNSKFIRKLKIRNFKNNYKVPQYCCNSCANSHVHTIESKQKISKSVSKERLHKCPKCGKNFMHIGSSISTTWCDECFEKENGHSREYAKSNIQHRYPNSNKRKIGNDVPLHSSKCPNCEKVIWSKTSDEVYCYDCVKELHKHLHQLFDENGKRIVKESTCKKLSKLTRERVANGTHIGWKVRPIESYPEKFWKQVLENNHIEFEFNFYIQKKALGLSDLAGYFLDFKLQNKIDLEIDGKQHKYEDRKQSDLVRDNILSSNGWKVYRIEWNEINTEKGKNLMKQKIDDFLAWFKLNS